MYRTLFAVLCLVGPLFAGSSLGPSSLVAAELQRLGDVTFGGDLESAEDISAVARVGDGKYLVVAGDEGSKVQILKRTAENEYTVKKTVPLLGGDDGDEEIDIEGIARSGNRVYVIGSHSRKRSKVDPTKRSRSKNLARLEENERERPRENLFRFRLTDDGEVTEAPVAKSLRKPIKEHPVLGDFVKIPSKENGIDIEGVASDGDDLFAAFRGPVLRGGYVPVLVFDFGSPKDAEVRFVNLGGRGVRDVARVSDGFLLIGGPVGDEPVDFQVYFWNGEDCIGGDDVPPRPFPKSLGVISPPAPGANAEGLAVLEETDRHYDVLIVFDGVARGLPTRYRVEKW